MEVKEHLLQAICNKKKCVVHVIKEAKMCKLLVQYKLFFYKTH